MKQILAMMLALLVTTTVAATPVASKEGPGYPKTAYSTDVSDIWWNPSESGWGMQMVQESNFVFATLFIYGPDGKPTWFTATLAANGGLVFSGPLYVTNGPWFGGAFNPSAFGIRQAGTMTFTLITVGTGVLTYSIDGVQVTKQVERETLTLEDYNGSYVVGIKFQATGCFNPSNNGVISNGMSITISQTGSNMSSLFYFPNGPVCTYSGNYGQSGHLGALAGNFSCTTGEVGQILIFEMTNRIGMISGRMQGSGTNTGCQYTGYFSGIDPSKAPR